MKTLVIGDLSTFTQMVSVVVIAMGSNHNPKFSFDTAFIALNELGSVQYSSVVVGQDFTRRTTDEYHNACAVLNLNYSQAFGDIYHRIKQIECLCGRCVNGPLVPMDLDILAVSDGEKWLVSQKRLPFKAHERAGLDEVVAFLLNIKDK
ncbi:2-amino-4-hydroxy-6-hydroxymethyldihydropteridine diphosphokinase [Moraxella sp. ZY200743]|uniref:2-amino-4-hydroxy-6- hydroxymethyldihydropteridine diphosphokinase n=1 Tax=Moraxella sp. ZY200743 TaxID=2911970 RepID=UPI003D7CC1B0